MRAIIILVTGHPATGKTTLANYLADKLGWPLISKDQIKELLLDVLGCTSAEESRQLSSVSWALLYQQIENLLGAQVSHITESNFDPVFANARWQVLSQKYSFELIQIRCETEPEILLQRYKERISKGERHSGHVDASGDKTFLTSIKEHMEWVDVASARISFDTSGIQNEDKKQVLREIKNLISESL